MTKKQLILLSLGSLLMILAAALLIRLVSREGSMSQERIRARLNILHTGSAQVSVVPNKSDLVAEVQRVDRDVFPTVHLTLRVIESRDIGDFTNLLKPGETIIACPQYIYKYTAGIRQIALADPRNIRNFQAYYLLPKDRIKAVAKATGGPTTTLSWWITDITRLLIEEQEPEVAGSEISPAPAPLSPNKSKIIGRVLRVERKEYPGVELTLKVVESIDVSDFSNFLAAGVTITARPYYVYERGKFLPTESHNSKSLLAYYLLPGDMIEAEASLGPGNGRLIWIISNPSRLPQESEGR